LAKTESDIFHLLEEDRTLSADVRTHLVATLFASPSSLAVGALAGAAAGLSAATLSSDQFIIAVGLAVPLAGVARVIQADFAIRSKEPGRHELAYELGAWAFSGLLGLLAYLVLTRTHQPGLHLLTACVALGYAAGICARNAGRPAIALGQLTLAALPLSAALAQSNDPTRWVLAAVNLLFILGMSDITRKTYYAFQSAVAVSRARECAIRDELDLLPNMIWSADAHGKATYRSVRWKEFTGLDPSDWGDGVLLVHAADHAALKEAWRRSVQTGAPFEATFRLRSKSGGYRRVLSRGRAEKDEQDRVVSWHGACVDIHDYIEGRAA
jgi:PAS domain-containing protein